MAKKGIRSRWGSIEEIEPGTYYRCWWTVNGKRKSHYVRGTWEDADMYLAKQRIATDGAKEDTTYDQYWDAVVWPSCQSLSENTKSDYLRYWDAYLSKRIANVAISSTTVRFAQQVISEIESPSMQAKCKVLWRKICRMAMEQDGILDHNPITRDVKTAKVVHREKVLVDVQDVLNIMDKIKGIKYEPIILFSLGCGLSPEESLALCWEDIEFDDGYAIADISKTLVSVRGKRNLKQDAKNKFRIRKAVLGHPFSDRLAEIKSSGPLCKGQSYNPNSELDAESFASPTTVAHNWKTWCEFPGHNVVHVTLENMRTSYSTMCGEAAIPRDLVSMAMGHSDGTTRGNNYQKNTIRAMKLVADLYCDYIMETPRRDDDLAGYVTTAKAGEMLCLSAVQVMNLCKKGKLPSKKVGSRWFVDSSYLR